MSEEIAAPAVQDANAQEPSNSVNEVKEADTPQIEEADETPEAAKERLAKQQAHFEKRDARQRKALQETQRQLQEERLQREAVAKRLAEYEAKANPLDDKPNPENFDTTEDYADALADWKISQKTKAEAEKAKEPNIDEIVEQRLKFKEQETAFRTQEAEFRKINPDYDKNAQVVNLMTKDIDPNHPSTRAFAQTLTQSPNPAALINYLGANPAEIASMMNMNPYDLTERLAEIEEQLAEPKHKTPEVDLPEPPSALRGSAKVRKGLNDMSPKELTKWAEGQ